VQRWEKREDMPVHRHFHVKGGTVYAFKKEIDGWVTGRGKTSGESRPMKGRSRHAAKRLIPSPHVMRHMFATFRLWLAIVMQESCQDLDDMAVPDARIVPRYPDVLNEGPKSESKVRTRQLVTRRGCRPLSLALQ
jgi:hypothetical protein